MPPTEGVRYGQRIAANSVRKRHRSRGSAMTDHVYRVTEIVGTSPDGVDAAIRNAITRAGKTLRNIDWFEVVSVRGHMEEAEIHHFQVTLKVGFRLEDE
jgi:flavin-binding protein dodecin